MTLTTALVVGVAPRERAGAAASLSETSGVLGGALGVAVLGSVGAAVYRARAPEAAGETLGEAVERGIGPLREAAEAAFVDGLVVMAVISGALMVLVAAATLAVLRRAGADQASSVSVM
jgi:DHA2 family multidrug resistance protein-like MFS transporter